MNALLASPAIATFRALLPGIALCVVVTAVAAGMARIEGMLFGRVWIETLVIAILLGTVIRSLWTPPKAMQAGIAYSGKQLLEFAVVLLGASISGATILAAGPVLLVSIAIVVVASLSVSFAIGRALGLPWRMATLIACGNAICGNSAIAAVAPVIGASSADVAASIAFTAVLGVVTVLTLPLIGEALGMSLVQYGTLAGMTVYAVPQVLAATVPVGALAAQVGTLVKLVRVLMLGPVMLVLSIMTHRAGADGKRTRMSFGKMVPWFITGFLAMIIVRSLGLIPEMLIGPIGFVAGALTTLAMAALGLGVDVRVVARSGLQVTAAVTGSLVTLILISVALIFLLGVS